MLVHDRCRLHRGVKHGVSNIVREHLGARTGMRDKASSMLFGELIYPWIVLLSSSCFVESLNGLRGVGFLARHISGSVQLLQPYLLAKI